MRSSVAADSAQSWTLVAVRRLNVARYSFHVSCHWWLTGANSSPTLSQRGTDRQTTAQAGSSTHHTRCTSDSRCSQGTAVSNNLRQLPYRCFRYRAAATLGRSDSRRVALHYAPLATLTSHCLHTDSTLTPHYSWHTCATSTVTSSGFPSSVVMN